MNRSLPVVAVALMSLSLVAVVALSGREPAWATPEEPVARAIEVATDVRPIEVVLGTRWSPVQGYERTRGLAECLRVATGRPVTLLQRGTYAEANALIASGRGDLALVCSGATADPRLRTSMTPAWRLDAGTAGKYRGVLVVRPGDPAMDLVDLRGATIAWTDPDSLTGYRAARAAVRALGEEPDAYFGPSSFTHAHDASIDAVVQGFVRVAAVDEEVYRARTTTGLRVVWRSAQFPSPPLLVRAGNPELERALTALADRPECLSDLGASRLLPSDWALYDSLEDTIRSGE